MSQHEYAVPLAKARPEDIPAVSNAYRAGEIKEQDRILAELQKYRNNGEAHLAWFVLEGIVRGDRTST